MIKIQFGSGTKIKGLTMNLDLAINPLEGLGMGNFVVFSSFSPFGCGSTEGVRG